MVIPRNAKRGEISEPSLLDELNGPCDVQSSILTKWNTPTRQLNRSQSAMTPWRVRIAARSCQRTLRRVTAAIGRARRLHRPNQKRATRWRFSSASFPASGIFTKVTEWWARYCFFSSRQSPSRLVFWRRSLLPDLESACSFSIGSL